MQVIKEILKLTIFLLVVGKLVKSQEQCPTLCSCSTTVCYYSSQFYSYSQNEYEIIQSFSQQNLSDLIMIAGKTYNKNEQWVQAVKNGQCIQFDRGQNVIESDQGLRGNLRSTGLSVFGVMQQIQPNTYENNQTIVYGQQLNRFSPLRVYGQPSVSPPSTLPSLSPSPSTSPSPSPSPSTSPSPSPSPSTSPSPSPSPSTSPSPSPSPSTSPSPSPSPSTSPSPSFSPSTSPSPSPLQSSLPLQFSSPFISPQISPQLFGIQRPIYSPPGAYPPPRVEGQETIFETRIPISSPPVVIEPLVLAQPPVASQQTIFGTRRPLPSPPPQVDNTIATGLDLEFQQGNQDQIKNLGINFPPIATSYNFSENTPQLQQIVQAVNSSYQEMSNNLTRAVNNTYQQLNNTNQKTE